MMSHRSLCIVITCATLLWSAAVWAAPHGGPRRSSSSRDCDAPPVVEPAAAEKLARARAHHAQAVAQHDAGNDAAALLEFERAYALSPAYQLLFNLGQLEHRLGRTANARRYLQRYLAHGGPCIAPERRARVEAQLELLSDPAQTLPQAARAAQPPEPKRKLARRVTWISAGVLGLGAAGTGVATWFAAQRHDRLRTKPAVPGAGATARARLDRQAALVGSLSVITDALALAALGAAGLGIYLMSSDDAAEVADEALAVRVGPGSVELSGSF